MCIRDSTHTHTHTHTRTHAHTHTLYILLGPLVLVCCFLHVTFYQRCTSNRRWHFLELFLNFPILYHPVIPSLSFLSNHKHIFKCYCHPPRFFFLFMCSLKILTFSYKFSCFSIYIPCRFFSLFLSYLPSFLCLCSSIISW